MQRSITAQVCEVNKALLSASKAVAPGNNVVFGDGDGTSYIEDTTTRERMWLEAEGGMFALKMWVQSGSGASF